MVDFDKLNESINIINEVLNGSSDDKEIATAIVVNEILSGN